MSSRPPTVSIGLPVYNGERFLAETLDAILAQTYEDFELIIADNASTDRTGQICQAYAARDGRIRYVRNGTNLGAARNFNRVFELSTGRYFKWWAADDLCAPTFLERCVQALDATPEASVAYPRVRTIDTDGLVLPNRYEQATYHADWSPCATVRFRQLVEEYMYSGGVTAGLYIFGLIRSSALKQTRLLGNYIASDWITVAELILLGTFVEVPEYLLSLRAHPGSSSMGQFRHRPEKVQEFFDPAIRGRILLLVSVWRCYWEHFVAVARSPLNPGQKTVLLAYTAGSMMRRARRRLGGQSRGGQSRAA